MCVSFPHVPQMDDTHIINERIHVSVSFGIFMSVNVVLFLTVVMSLNVILRACF